MTIISDFRLLLPVLSELNDQTDYNTINRIYDALLNHLDSEGISPEGLYLATDFVTELDRLSSKPAWQELAPIKIYLATKEANNLSIENLRTIYFELEKILAKIDEEFRLENNISLENRPE